MSSAYSPSTIGSVSKRNRPDARCVGPEDKVQKPEGPELKSKVLLAETEHDLVAEAQLIVWVDPIGVEPGLAVATPLDVEHAPVAVRVGDLLHGTPEVIAMGLVLERQLDRGPVAGLTERVAELADAGIELARGRVLGEPEVTHFDAGELDHLLLPLLPRRFGHDVLGTVRNEEAAGLELREELVLALAADLDFEIDGEHGALRRELPDARREVRDEAGMLVKELCTLTIDFGLVVLGATDFDVPSPFLAVGGNRREQRSFLRRHHLSPHLKELSWMSAKPIHQLNTIILLFI